MKQWIADERELPKKRSYHTVRYMMLVIFDRRRERRQISRLQLPVEPLLMTLQRLLPHHKIRLLANLGIQALRTVVEVLFTQALVSKTHKPHTHWNSTNSPEYANKADKPPPPSPSQQRNQ